MTPRFKLFNISSTSRYVPGLSVLRAIGVVTLNLFLFASVSSCSKDNDDTVPPAGSNTEGTVVIDSTTVSSAAAEGNTGNAADEDDLLANSTFFLICVFGCFTLL